MFLIPFLVLIVLALVVWALVEFTGSTAPDSAVTIARRRLAAGEISSDEFQQIYHKLGTGPDRPGRGIALLAVPIAGLMLLAIVGSAAAWGGGWGWGWGGMGQMMGGMGGMMGGGQDSSLSPVVRGSANETVIIANFAYSPGDLQVPLGAKVTWTNRDSAPHSATASDGSWDTGVLSKGQSATLTFNHAGTYSYYCSVHSSMKAKLVVQ